MWMRIEGGSYSLPYSFVIPGLTGDSSPDPLVYGEGIRWIPAFAGMTRFMFIPSDSEARLFNPLRQRRYIVIFMHEASFRRAIHQRCHRGRYHG